MPDLLIFSSDKELLLGAENAAGKSRMRVKSVLDFESAKEWLSIRRFSAMVCDAQTNLEQQTELGNLLWTKNSAAPLFLVSLSQDSAVQRGRARLAGAELISGSQALERLKVELNALEENKVVLESADRSVFRILVVEDLDAPRDIICSYVESLGFPLVEGEGSAAVALNRLEQSPDYFSCIVTDIRMPEMGGKELIDALRKHPKLQQLPIIVLTAYGTADCLVDCLKAGASGFLVKPPKKKDLVRELARAMRIALRRQSPRMATPGEAEMLRDLILEGAEGLA